jgi:signal peptidase
MEPAITQGSMIFVYHERPGEIQNGDIITYYSEVNGKIVRITHRVVDKSDTPDGYIFQTKGDALTSADRQWIPEQNLIGEVKYSVPMLGELVQKYREYNLFTVSLILLASAVTINYLRIVIQQNNV